LLHVRLFIHLDLDRYPLAYFGKPGASILSEPIVGGVGLADVKEDGIPVAGILVRNNEATMVTVGPDLITVLRLPSFIERR
jgi:hypothetical protein